MKKADTDLTASSVQGAAEIAQETEHDEEKFFETKMNRETPASSGFRHGGNGKVIRGTAGVAPPAPAVQSPRLDPAACSTSSWEVAPGSGGTLLWREGGKTVLNPQHDVHPQSLRPKEDSRPRHDPAASSAAAAPHPKVRRLHSPVRPPPGDVHRRSRSKKRIPTYLVQAEAEEFPGDDGIMLRRSKNLGDIDKDWCIYFGDEVEGNLKDGWLELTSGGFIPEKLQGRIAYCRILHPIGRRCARVAEPRLDPTPREQPKLRHVPQRLDPATRHHHVDDDDEEQLQKNLATTAPKWKSKPMPKPKPKPKPVQKVAVDQKKTSGVKRPLQHPPPPPTSSSDDDSSYTYDYEDDEVEEKKEPKQIAKVIFVSFGFNNIGSFENQFFKYPSDKKQPPQPHIVARDFEALSRLMKHLSNNFQPNGLQVVEGREWDP